MFEHFEIFWMSGVLLVFSSILSRMVVFDIVSEEAYLAIEMLLEVELIVFSQSQLTVVVIQALFGYTYHFGSILQVEPPPHSIRSIDM